LVRRHWEACDDAGDLQDWPGAERLLRSGASVVMTRLRHLPLVRARAGGREVVVSGRRFRASVVSERDRDGEAYWVVQLVSFERREVR
jgi:hypothetical protein